MNTATKTLTMYRAVHRNGTPHHVSEFKSIALAFITLQFNPQDWRVEEFTVEVPDADKQ